VRGRTVPPSSVTVGSDEGGRGFVLPPERDGGSPSLPRTAVGLDERRGTVSAVTHLTGHRLLAQPGGFEGVIRVGKEMQGPNVAVADRPQLPVSVLNLRAAAGSQRGYLSLRPQPPRDTA
jgi:hypothetical protein